MQNSYTDIPPRPSDSKFPDYTETQKHREVFYRNTLYLYSAAIHALKPQLSQNEIHELAVERAKDALEQADREYKDFNRVRLEEWEVHRCIGAGYSRANYVLDTMKAGTDALEELDKAVV